MTAVEITQLRNRAWGALSPQTASAMGVRLDQLQQFLVSAYTPTAVQLANLARYFNCCGHG